ncbi:hypothetical protein [Paenibacillus soyae]|uniref:Uncharacterized protein n=1 Tax=Paenibacillus soyae TaxID=2969249 RepID=A0A9X2S9C8_9BACL|nr:hypothetical protein [Paenibacillus soyae]MCR2805324.1 hypothetical protein [Paenibacillus soyae]
MKTLADRVLFYTRKANSYSQRRYDVLTGRTTQRPPSNRFVRLIAYRDAFRSRVEAERGASL